MHEVANEKHWVKWWRRIRNEKVAWTLKIENFDRQWHINWWA